MTPVHWIFYILGIVVAFFLLGFASPKRFQVKAELRLPAPPDRVWPYLVEPELLPRWFPFVVECVPVAGSGRAVGDRRRVRLDRWRRIGEREEVLAKLAAPRFVAFEHSRERWVGRSALWRDSRLEFGLEPSEGGSTLRASYWFDGVGYLGRMFCLLFLRKRHQADLRLALTYLEKRLVEETFGP